MTCRIHILSLALLPAACVTGKSVGEIDTEDSGGSADSGDPSDGATEPDPSAGDTGVPGMCLEEPTQCTSDGFCSAEGCGVTDHWDENGCPRPGCGGANECPDGLVCFHFADWNLGTSSGWGCDLEDGECLCGETADANPDVSHCVPEAIMPPAVERCVTQIPGAAFAVEPALGDSGGTSQCTVLATEPLELDCTGDFTGAFTIALGSSAALSLPAGETVTLEYDVQSQGSWADEWLRILADDGATVSVVAVQASALLPTDAADPFWPTNVELDIGDIGCLRYTCDPESILSITGRSIRVGQGGEAIDFAGGEAGNVPGKFGGQLPVITVLEAREGACETDPAEQPSWYSFVIVQT